jgi:hypothetical protein
MTKKRVQRTIKRWKNEITQKMALKIFYVKLLAFDEMKLNFYTYILLMMNNDEHYIFVYLLKKTSKN